MKEITPNFKYNGGIGATLCLSCRIIIHTELGETLLCHSCQKNILETIVNTPNDEELGKKLRENYAIKL